MGWNYSYSIFDQKGAKIELGDVEQRAVWYVHGNSQEEVFVERYGKALGLGLNPEKKTDPAAPDLADGNRLGDLKCQTTPLFTAKIHYRIDPTYAVTFNLKDALHYGPYGKDYKGFTIFYWIDWVAVKMEMGVKTYAVEPLQGVWKVAFADLERLRVGAPIHWYNRRWKVRETNEASAARLAMFEPRLMENGETSAIRGKGGNAACSYVFDLRNFEKVA